MKWRKRPEPSPSRKLQILEEWGNKGTLGRVVELGRAAELGRAIAIQRVYRHNLLHTCPQLRGVMGFLKFIPLIEISEWGGMDRIGRLISELG
jgi:hypothetical protein